MTISALWFDGLDNPTTYIGMLSTGIAIALQDPMINIVDWICLLAHRPFEIGDGIEIGDVTDGLIDIGILRFALDHFVARAMLSLSTLFFSEVSDRN